MGMLDDPLRTRVQMVKRLMEQDAKIAEMERIINAYYAQHNPPPPEPLTSTTEVQCPCPPCVTVRDKAGG